MIMSNKKNNKFFELSHELNEVERKTLLQKLSRQGKEKIIEVPEIEKKKGGTSQLERISYARNVYKKANFLDKIIFKIISLFNGKKIEYVVIEQQLEVLKKELTSKYARYFDFEQSRLTSSFIERFMPLIIEVNNLYDDFILFHEDRVAYYDFLSHLVEKSLTGDIIDVLEDTYPQNLESNKEFLEKENYIVEKNKRLKRYIAKLEGVNLTSLNQQFKMFDLFLKVTYFEFRDILSLFLISDIEEPISKANYSNVTNVLPIMEKFYRILKSVNFKYDEILIFDDFFEYFSAYKVHGKTSKTIDFSSHRDTIITIFKRLEEINKNIPFAKIFQYFNQDLLYMPAPINYNVNILDIYKTYKKTYVDKTWDNHYTALRQQNIMNLLHGIFDNYNFDSFEHFNNEIRDNLEKSTQRRLTDFYSVNLIAEFLKRYYRNNLEALINKILIDGIFKKEVVRATVSAAYYTLNSMHQKLKEFDTNFAENKEMGKKIGITLRKALNDPNFKTPLMNIVGDINEDTGIIKQEFAEALQIIYKFLITVMDIRSPENNPITNVAQIRISTHANIFVALEKAVEIINRYNEVQSLVEESF